MSVGPKIRLLCPNLACRKVLSVPANLRGRTIRCSICGTTVRVPIPKSQPGDGQPAKSG